MNIKDFNRLLLRPYSVKWNHVKLGRNVSKQHNLLLLKVCMRLVENEDSFLTEVEFKGGGRCDVLLPFKDLIFEIIVTESEERFLKKGMYYPEEFTVLPIRCVEDIDHVLPLRY